MCSLRSHKHEIPFILLQNKNLKKTPITLISHSLTLCVKIVLSKMSNVRKKPSGHAFRAQRETVRNKY
jgi:hypothetical protein